MGLVMFEAREVVLGGRGAKKMDMLVRIRKAESREAAKGALNTALHAI
jgi:hypothetical protein